MRAAAVLAVVIACSTPVRADEWPVEAMEQWKRAHDREVAGCVASARVTGTVSRWFSVEAGPRGARVADLLPATADDRATPCLRTLFDGFRPSAEVKAYVSVSCDAFPGRTPSCGLFFEKVRDGFPPRALAWMVETQLAGVLPAFERCVVEHGRHLRQLELLVEHVYSAAMSVRYLGEQPQSSLRDPEPPDRNSAALGACYAAQIAAARSRLVWPPSLPTVDAPPLEVHVPPSYPTAHAPRVSVSSRPR